MFACWHRAAITHSSTNKCGAMGADYCFFRNQENVIIHCHYSLICSSFGHNKAALQFLSIRSLHACCRKKENKFMCFTVWPFLSCLFYIILSCLILREKIASPGGGPGDSFLCVCGGGGFSLICWSKTQCLHCLWSYVFLSNLWSMCTFYSITGRYVATVMLSEINLGFKCQMNVFSIDIYVKMLHFF